jgi:serine/threonine protein kinase
MQRRRRKEEDAGEEASPRTPGGHRTPRSDAERDVEFALSGFPPDARSGHSFGERPAGCRDTAPSGPSSPASPGINPPRKDADRRESGLLARRRRKAPDLRPSHLEIDKKTENQETVRIRHLEPGVKIFDLYYWDEVIQEEGCGGKVVVCSPKVPGEESPLSPCSPFSNKSGSVQEISFFPQGEGEKRSSGSSVGDSSPKRMHRKGTHVMKIKSKAELHKAKAEEQFRKAHLKMLNLPPHTGILPLYEVLEDDNFYYVVMEKANGGSLLCSLVEEYSDGIMPESAVRKLMREILSAIGHINKQGMLHRDIKVDNLVVQVHDEPDSPGEKIRTVRIIDFDIADADWEPMSPGKRIPGWVGTVRTAAPETFGGCFSQRSDLYSVGTVLYLLMTGRLPHDDSIFREFEKSDDMELLYERLQESEIAWDLPSWEKHQACKDFCKTLLAFDPEKRPACADEAARHRWFFGSKVKARD